MSRLHEQVASDAKKGVEILPPGLRALAADAHHADQRSQEEKAAFARRTFADARMRREPLEKAEAAYALANLAFEKAQGETFLAKHRAGCAYLDVARMSAALDHAEKELRKQLVPAYQVAAARAVLEAEKARYDGGGPVRKPVNPKENMRQADGGWRRVIDVKQHLQGAEQVAWSTAARVIDTALDDLRNFSAGTIEPPADLARWVDDVCDDAARYMQPADPMVFPL